MEMSNSTVDTCSVNKHLLINLIIATDRQRDGRVQGALTGSDEAR